MSKRFNYATFSEEQYRAILKRVLYLKKKYRPLLDQLEPEEILNEIMLGYIDNPKSRKTFEQAALDIIRKHNGRRLKDGSNPCYMIKNALPIDDNKDISKMETPCNLEVKWIIEEFSRKFDMKDRTIMQLFYKWGFYEREIGEVIGMTEAGVSRRLFIIKSKIKRKFRNEENI